MAKITRDEIIEAARAAHAITGGSLSLKQFAKHSGIKRDVVYSLFHGGWTEVRKIIGIERHPMEHKVASEDELLAEYYRVAIELGEIPTWAKYNARARFHSDMFRRRFGGLQQTLTAFRNWLESNHPSSPLLEKLDTKSKHEIARPPEQRGADRAGPVWNKVDGIEYGAPINFRGLRHAPINEQGVVYLFGMVSYEIGLVVEAVQAGFPDCEAKRCVDSRKSRWQRVRIEFEFCSRNFRDHGHDVTQCDLIVCWEHNWPECPLKVIELRTLLNQLEG